MRTETPKTIYLKDYKPYPYKLLNVDLNFDLYDGKTIVTSKLNFQRVEKGDLYLNGEDIELVSLKLNGQEFKSYQKDEKTLIIPCPDEEEFELEIVTKIIPESNTRLEGLYQSGGNYCTQCEAEGFRRITYFPDRPDVLSTYTVRIEADKKKYPVLLSNGNLIEKGECLSSSLRATTECHEGREAIQAGHQDSGLLRSTKQVCASRNDNEHRHYTVWHDPFPKPCYLFALVAGDLNHIRDTFTTSSGREVELYIYVRPGDEEQCGHAMDSLKRSMKWDEDVYGLEYDLELFNIVAVSDFNMGAMENKSLNIFNTALVLAHPETATDTDFMRVESVIAHEYFHNWSGNRVTCRDWFQLSLKEGLTVFRDQEFSADMHSRDVQRIDDVTHLRRHQFPEDASPLSHPIRPDNYIEINNFYTMTVYEKGAEVIRMMRTLLGPENYRKGTDLYFERHDGQAVRCDDFVQAMEDASGYDLTQFKLWYAQSGTPKIDFEGEYNEKTKTYRAKLKQKIPSHSRQDSPQAMHIPVALGLLGQDGEDLIGTQILDLKEEEQDFTFENVKEQPVPSVLRGFSAPVILNNSLSDEDLVFLSKHDSDGFNQWEAGQVLAKTILHKLTDQIEAKEKPQAPERFVSSYENLLQNALEDRQDKALLARALGLPEVSIMVQERELADPTSIYKARETLLAALKRAHKPLLQKIYKVSQIEGAFSLESKAMGQRALRNSILSLLTATHGTGCAKLAKEHYEGANNMTDRVAALASLSSNENSEREDVFYDFYERFKSYPLVVDKWFSLQAMGVRKNIINDLKNLKEHTDFNIKNPNRVRSLYSAFAFNNPACFHAQDGSGYAFLSDAIIGLNAINPQIGARLLTPMRGWKQLSLDRQEKMKSCLERILQTPHLAPDIFEIASKSLKA